ncbi:Prefoldin subunit 5 [Trichoplax sp. H2]|uniref:Prefoldin subunit 5 n=1 Tax=Trichoplax adhaerens TaxID=10228 RepID=B3RQD6_TRIAD|nr:hypothetical protein TRIADDRAFT_53868 [Trichoplax adhaerens]EDV28325.1 hypothetical protein TRIADDRAFT_53868 [Trichoplax adhaerens]RDD45678.1 Prefoldin subunit 5 [Trichoplax sp. H2]|eukprot:XP_002110159.1 hypothetical protein TRIADDRAFT_53868 [Trichoplax adhaerens]
MAAAESKAIDLAQLPIPQLEQLKSQLDEEVQMFTSSVNQLQLVQQKFVESSECVKKLSVDQYEAKEILVPMTDSLYVPGVLNNAHSLLVDIGTGYFADKNIKEGIEYFERKVKFVQEQLEKLQKLVMEKFNLRQAVIEHMQIKIEQHLAAQKSGAKA